MKYVFFLLLTILAASCSDSNSDCIEVNYNEDIEVMKGDMLCFPNDITIEIISLNNEFCPCNLACIVPGEMTVDLGISTMDEFAEYTLHTADYITVDEKIPGGLSQISFSNIIFEEDCSDSNPHPEITSTILNFRN